MRLGGWTDKETLRTSSDGRINRGVGNRYDRSPPRSWFLSFWPFCNPLVRQRGWESETWRRRKSDTRSRKRRGVTYHLIPDEIRTSVKTVVVVLFLLRSQGKGLRVSFWGQLVPTIVLYLCTNGWGDLPPLLSTLDGLSFFSYLWSPKSDIRRLDWDRSLHKTNRVP